jgi:2-polyprenyl-3-methyl-5-hydroxy-6-metoxy-1,4-benzoquinol methylase
MRSTFRHTHLLFSYSGTVMNKSLLVRMFGFPATLIHGETGVMERWRWLSERLPRTRNEESLLEIGCGSGAFTIGAARRGYNALGLSWDVRNQTVAAERAQLCKAPRARFEVLDVRALDTRADFLAQFDVVVCLENIEHVLDDRKLMHDIADCIKPGGRLLLSSPNLRYREISAGDLGPFSKVENGQHVRRGYSPAMLRELCKCAGLEVEEISYISGFLSQKIAAFQRVFQPVHPMLGWLLVLPLRPLPPLFDRALTYLLRWPGYSIALEAYKPRWPDAVGREAVEVRG